MKLAWVSPLPPLASGIADYSFELLPLIAERADVTVVSPAAGRLRRLRVPDGMRVISPEAWRDRRGSFDLTLFHLGNNPFHRYAYEAALEWPGVAVFHDFVLHHMLVNALYETQREPTRYVRLLESELGADGRRLAEIRMDGFGRDLEKFLFPMSAHVARAATSIVVHSQDARDRMLDAAPGVPVTVIPHYAPAAPAAVAGMDRTEARRQLGLPHDAFVVGHFGFITWPKQPEAVLRGFAKLLARRPGSQLALVGADHLGGELRRLISSLGLEENVRHTGFVDLVDFYRYLRAVDVVVNLRYPTAGESSGTVARALMEERPVIVNDVGAFAELPDGAACKVELDGDQAAEVGRWLIRLSDDPGFRDAVARAGRVYAATALDPRRCRDLYLDVAERAAAAAVTPA